MRKSTKCSPEVRERAVRMVQEHRGEYPSLWAAIELIAPKIGCVPQTLHEWVRKQKIDTGMREGTTSEELDRIKALEREVKELRRANEILKLASAFLAQAELDRRLKSRGTSWTSIVTSTGSSRSARFCRLPRQGTGVVPLANATRKYAVAAPSVMMSWPLKLNVSDRPTCKSTEQTRSGSR